MNRLHLLTVSTEQLTSGLRQMAVAVGVLVGLSALAHCSTGCEPPKSPAEVEAAYTAELVSCSTKAKTKDEAKVCRRAVNTRYGLCEAQWPRITPCDE